MEDLDALKSDRGNLRIYGKYVRNLRKSGELYTGCCPLHSDSSPSFSVYPDMRWTCFSGPNCGSGNIFQLIERVDGVSFQQAVERVKQELGTTDTWKSDKDRVEQVFKPVAETKTYKTLPKSKAEEIATSLTTAAANYLEQERGISFETAKRFKIGFRQTVAFQDPKCSDILDKGWLLIPYIDGDVVRQVKFRSLFRKKPGGFQRSPGMETVLFNTDTIDAFEPVYLTSGEFDAMVLEQAGFHAVSLMADSHKPTPAQKDQLMSASVVILAGDTDESGAGIIDKLWRELGSRAYKLSWPVGVKDANEFFLKQCNRDLSIFRTKVEELTAKAKSQPMPDVYSIQSVLENGDSQMLSEHPDRLRFPWSSADKMANVLPEDVLGVGSTNTGMGKTMWTVQLSLFNARKYGKVVLNYQAEMRPSEIATMIAAQVLRKDRNFLTAEDRKLAANEIEGVQYFVGNNPLLTDINDVLDVIEAAVRRLGADIVILDHFHHLTVGMDNETKIQQMAMTRIKQIAQVYKVIFINVGQPRKATQATKTKQIHITDFKGSGAWGDAANAAIVLHRDLNKSDDPTLTKGVYEDKCLVKLLKGRSMGVGASAAYITCFGEFSCFEEISNYEEPPNES